MVVPDPAGPGGERVKVLDFGIAKLASAAGQTKAGQIMGTVLYMSPEQIRKPAEVDGQSDVYSLGAVLYALLAGRPPFVAKNNDLLVLTMHISHPPDPIEQVVPGLSPSLAALVMRMLHKSPTDRPTMPAVAEQLLAMDAGAGAHAGRRISRTALPVLTAQPGLTSHSASGAGTAPSQPSGSGLGGHSDAGLGSRGGPADGLTVSTLAQGAGQRLQGGTRAGGGLRRAVPLLALAAVAIGGVVVVSAVRSSSPAGPATSREEPRGSPTSKPLPRTTDPTPMTNSPLGRDGSAAADGKTGSAGTKPAKPRPADGKAAAADKLRKKNAAPTGKTTPLIR